MTLHHLNYLDISIHEYTIQTNPLPNTQNDVASYQCQYLLSFLLLLIHETKQNATSNIHVHEIEDKNINDNASFEPLGYLNTRIYQTNKLMPEYIE